MYSLCTPVNSASKGSLASPWTDYFNISALVTHGKIEHLVMSLM